MEEDPDAKYITQYDGSPSWYKPHEMYKSFTLYYLDCLRQDYLREPRAPVPEVFIALANAQDREAAMDQVIPNWRNWRTDHNLKVVLDLDRLVEDGEIVEFSWVDYVYEASGVER